jgi:hypothetical protein
MPSTNTPSQSPEIKTRDAVHEPFSWFSEEAKDYPLANFVGLTRDVCNGIETCLEIINSAALDREAAEDGNDVIPAINTFEADNLLRLAMAASRLMAYEAEGAIKWINEFGPARLKAEQENKNRREKNASTK